MDPAFQNNWNGMISNHTVGFGRSQFPYGQAPLLILGQKGADPVPCMARMGKRKQRMQSPVCIP
ncbi:MAG: hypothetical protein NZM65_07100 [Flavobacteriales bacterium]|nr:hypothetical protein [Flavobacteriales bacterium]MDW8410440.1 hypothetical protein [Flavobacteriales bacterium]